MGASARTTSMIARHTDAAGKRRPAPPQTAPAADVDAAAPDRSDAVGPSATPAQLRPPAEERWAAELEALAAADAASGAEVPAGWRLSPRSVRAFIVGDQALGVTRKFYGDDPLVDRAVVTLLGRQGLMLVGEPGTAKSMLSELLSAAVSGASTLTIQGSADTTKDHIRYSWNYVDYSLLELF